MNGNNTKVDQSTKHKEGDVSSGLAGESCEVGEEMIGRTSQNHSLICKSAPTHSSDGSHLVFPLWGEKGLTGSASVRLMNDNGG